MENKVKVVCNKSNSCVTAGKVYEVIEEKVLSDELYFYIIDDTKTKRMYSSEDFTPFNKFDKEYVENLLNTYMTFGNIGVTTNYGNTYSDEYNKNCLLDIDVLYQKDYKLSLEDMVNLRNFLSNLIEYFQKFDSNPFTKKEREIEFSEKANNKLEY